MTTKKKCLARVQMVSREIQVENEANIHGISSRRIALFAQELRDEYGIKTTITDEGYGETVDATNDGEILALGIEHEDWVTVTVAGRHPKTKLETLTHIWDDILKDSMVLEGGEELTEYSKQAKELFAPVRKT
ncbi:MAG: HPr family phosphocarrier protein [Methanobacteriota archaeon]